ncbi:22891_t:CDS:2 [Racocetra persica]|uniref:22891_t:CDS:1 n=1 Tax=Racocetra persica TaxID=160502 RepID=A0ACA9PFJ4_9GLOM|nr:22891_t:CDS:2 [Racocetra persica]
MHKDKAGSNKADRAEESALKSNQKRANLGDVNLNKISSMAQSKLAKVLSVVQGSKSTKDKDKQKDMSRDLRKLVIFDELSNKKLAEIALEEEKEAATAKNKKRNLKADVTDEEIIEDDDDYNNFTEFDSIISNNPLPKD